MRKSFLLLIPAAVMLLMGCATVSHAYDGEKLTPENLATVWTPALHMETINGKKYMGSTVFFVMPGENTVSMGKSTSADPLTNQYFNYSWDVAFLAEAGHTYYFYTDNNGAYWDTKHNIYGRDLGTDFTPPGQPFIASKEYKQLIEDCKNRGGDIKLPE